MSEPTKRSTIKRGKKMWEVDWGMDALGNRKRNLFKLEVDADKAIEEHGKKQKKDGEFWSRLSPVEKVEITGTLTAIKSAGLTVTQVWADYQRWKKDCAESTVEPMEYSKVVAEWFRRKTEAGKTSRYVENTRDVLLKFGEGREQVHIHKITATTLEEWFSQQAKENDWSLSTKRTYLLLFSSLWTVAIAKGWATLNITERMDEIIVPVPPVKIYENQRVIHILAGVLSNTATHSVLAPVVIGLFGCMRPEEISSDKAKSEGMSESEYFQWSDINLETARMKVRITKRGDERTIRLQPNCVEWLKLAKELENPLPPVNERRCIDDACELIDLEEWIRDGLRKTCATHLRQVYKNDHEVVLDLGNSVKVLLKHYAALHIPEEQSVDYWKINPERVREYMKSPEWRQFLKTAGETRTARLEAEAKAKAEAEAKEAAKKASEGQPKQKASGSEKSVR